MKYDKDLTNNYMSPSRLAKILNSNGIDYDWSKSGVSESEYFTVKSPYDHKENIKIRVSDHTLPPSYDAPNMEISATQKGLRDNQYADKIKSLLSTLLEYTPKQKREKMVLEFEKSLERTTGEKARDLKDIKKSVKESIEQDEREQEELDKKIEEKIKSGKKSPDEITKDKKNSMFSGRYDEVLKKIGERARGLGQLQGDERLKKLQELKELNEELDAMTEAYKKINEEETQRPFPIGTVRKWDAGVFKKVAENKWEKI